MKKDSYERLDDGFVNLYEEGIFVRCFEYSAVLISEITGYKLFANIDKKNGFIFLECGFVKTKKDEILFELENRGYSIRFVDKNGKINGIIGNIKLERNNENIVKIKKSLTKYSYDNI